MIIMVMMIVAVMMNIYYVVYVKRIEVNMYMDIMVLYVLCVIMVLMIMLSVISRWKGKSFHFWRVHWCHRSPHGVQKAKDSNEQILSWIFRLEQHLSSREIFFAFRLP